MIDLNPDANIDRVARIAAELGERIRDEDPQTMYDELVALCQFHPAKAAQLIMCHAAWFNPDETVSTLVARAQSITAEHPRLRSA